MSGSGHHTKPLKQATSFLLLLTQTSMQYPVQKQQLKHAVTWSPMCSVLARVEWSGGASWSSLQLSFSR